MIATNYSSLPIYDNEAKQFRNLKQAYSTEHFNLRASVLRLLPFQFTYDTNITAIKCEIIGVNNAVNKNITTVMQIAGLQFIYSITYDTYIVFFKANQDITGLDIERGQYYLKLTINNNNEFFSEVFTAMNQSDLDTGLKIVWSNGNDLEINNKPILLESFDNYVYLDTNVGLPEYSYEEEITEQKGYGFPEIITSKKAYKFKTHLPEYLLDVLRIVRLCDTVTIYSNNNTKGQIQEYQANRFLMSPEWLQGGLYAETEFEFQIDDVVNHSDPHEVQGGSFNNDYDTDYNNIENN